jgi:hypothetical protein
MRYRPFIHFQCMLLLSIAYAIPQAPAVQPPNSASGRLDSASATAAPFLMAQFTRRCAQGC